MWNPCIFVSNNSSSNHVWARCRFTMMSVLERCMDFNEWFCIDVCDWMFWDCREKNDLNVVGELNVIDDIDESFKSSWSCVYFGCDDVDTYFLRLRSREKTCESLSWESSVVKWTDCVEIQDARAYVSKWLDVSCPNITMSYCRSYVIIQSLIDLIRKYFLIEGIRLSTMSSLTTYVFETLSGSAKRRQLRVTKITVKVKKWRYDKMDRRSDTISTRRMRGEISILPISSRITLLSALSEFINTGESIWISAKSQSGFYTFLTDHWTNFDLWIDIFCHSGIVITTSWENISRKELTAFRYTMTFSMKCWNSSRRILNLEQLHIKVQSIMNP